MPKKAVTLDYRIFVYVLNSCGLVKVVQKKYCQISRTQEEIRPVEENLSRKICSSYRCVSKLVKKLVKEDLLVCAGLKSKSRIAGGLLYYSTLQDRSIANSYNKRLLAPQ